MLKKRTVHDIRYLEYFRRLACLTSRYYNIFVERSCNILRWNSITVPAITFKMDCKTIVIQLCLFVMYYMSQADVSYFILFLHALIVSNEIYTALLNLQ